MADQLQAPARRGVAIFRKIPQARQLNDVVGRQDRTDHISLRRGVNFIEMTLRFAKLHKLPDALV